MKTPQSKPAVAFSANKDALSSGVCSPFENFARVILLPGESPEEFDRLLAAHLEEIHPLTTSERAMVEIMVASKWRQKRIWGYFTFAFSRSEPDSSDQAARDSYAKAIDDLYRAEAVYGRMYRSARCHLAAWQPMRQSLFAPASQ